MQLSVRTEGPFRIVSVADARIDAAVALTFKEEMRAATSGKPDVSILDLTQVTFIDSSGLGAIVAIMKHLGADRRLILAGMTAPVARVFQLTRMDTVFSLFPSVDAALKAHAS